MKTSLLLDSEILSTLRGLVRSCCLKDLKFLVELRKRNASFFALDKASLDLFDRFVSDLVAYNAVKSSQTFVGFRILFKVYSDIL